MKQRAAFGLLFLGVIAAALFLRCGDLTLRPLHNDEAINAFKLRRLWTEGTYRYDPHEYHGPALYYFSLPVLAVAARLQPDQPDEAAMRAVPLLFGLGLILLLGLAADALGRTATLFAALFTAVSPAFVFFSRYYIHEMLLVFFTAVVLVSLWRYHCRPGPGWAAVLGAGIALMYATKETFVFALGAMVLGLVAAMPRPGTIGGGPVPARSKSGSPLREGWLHRPRDLVRVLRRVPRGHVILGGTVAFVIGLLFFTSFLSNPAGAIDALKTYWIWIARAGGATPHLHPWYFYLERLLWFHVRGGPVWTEAAILVLAAVGGIAGCSGRVAARQAAAARFLAGFSLALAAVYSLLPYKTPWCLLGFHHGLILLAGIGAGFLFHAARGAVGRGLTTLVGLALAVHLGGQAWRATREFAADFRNPFVYGHTSQDVYNLLEQIRELASVHPAGKAMPIAVIAPADNYWPLPWYLRDFGQVGWWSALPERPAAQVIVVASKSNAGLDEKSGQAWTQAGMFELRPRYFVELYVESALWKSFLAARAEARK